MPPENPGAQEILAVAVFKPVRGLETASLKTIHELSSIVTSKGYGRDCLYRDSQSQYVLLRYWRSEQSRAAALEDPDMLRCWAKLGNEIEIVTVYETLSEVLPVKAT
jgi:hypothetical protein